MRDELYTQLRDLEALARELRQMVLEEPELSEVAVGETAIHLAEALLAARDARQKLSILHRVLHSRGLERAAERTVTVRDAAQADLDRALGDAPPSSRPRRRPRPEPQEPSSQPYKPRRKPPVEFETLHQELGSEVLAVIARFLPEREDVEDLGVEIWITAYRGWEQFRASPVQEAYIFRCAFQKLVEHFGGRVPRLKDKRLIAILRGVREFERQISELNIAGEEPAARQGALDRLVGDFYGNLLPLPTADASRPEGDSMRDVPDMPSSGEGPRPVTGPRTDPPAEPPAGGAGVPAPLQPVPVLAGGAARTFEEAMEPPRNP